MKQRPNILVIITDQQSARAMSASGNPYLHTPHMDSLAAGGVRFERCYCTSPVWRPHRASLATERMPHAVGVNVNSDRPDASVPNLGHLFRQAGYYTAWAGKWGMPEGRPKGPDGTQGFENLPLGESDARYGTVGDEAVTDAAVAFISTRERSLRPFLLNVSLTNPHDICYWVMEPSAQCRYGKQRAFAATASRVCH